MRRFFFLLLFAALMLSLPAFARKFTRGFRIAKLYLDFPNQPQWEIVPNPGVASLLRQQFTFIGKGSQSYVFESQDGQTVVKLFRFDRSLPDAIQLFDACKLAYDSLRDETGLIYIHLNTTRMNLPTLRCKDAIGRSYKLPLDDYRFVVQRKGELFYSALLSARSRPPLMQKRLDQFLDLLQTRVSKEVLNADPSLSRNFGFLEDRAIELDFGNYRASPGLDREAEMRHYTAKLRSWLQENAPEWVSYLDQRVEALP
jgi:hypothetical protein